MTTTGMRSFLALVTLCLVLMPATALVAADLRMAPATVTRQLPPKDGTTQTKSDVLLIKHYNTDGLHFAHPKAPRQIQTWPLKDILDVAYDSAKDQDYLRAKSFFGSGRYDSAAEFFVKSAAASNYEWVRIDSHLQAAECFRRQKKYAEAIKEIDKLQKNFSKSVKVLDALYLKGQIQIAAGKAADGLKTFEGLGKQSRNFGPLAAKAKALGAVGRGEALMAQKQFDKAVSAMQAAIGELDATRFPQEFGQVSLALAKAQNGAGKADAALATYAKLCYQPVPPEVQGRAHLGRARILDSQGKKVEAFDAAVFAVVRGGSDPNVLGPARKLAKKIGTALSQDASLGPDLQKLYLDHTAKL